MLALASAGAAAVLTAAAPWAALPQCMVSQGGTEVDTEMVAAPYMPMPRRHVGGMYDTNAIGESFHSTTAMHHWVDRAGAPEVAEQLEKELNGQRIGGLKSNQGHRLQMRMQRQAAMAVAQQGGPRAQPPGQHAPRKQALPGHRGNVLFSKEYDAAAIGEGWRGRRDAKQLEEEFAEFKKGRRF